MSLLCSVTRVAANATIPCLVDDDFVDEAGEFDENAYDDFIKTVRHQERHDQPLCWDGRVLSRSPE